MLLVKIDREGDKKDILLMNWQAHPCKTGGGTNASRGYLPTMDAYDYGCYESYTSYFAKGTAEQLQVKYVEMLESLQ